MILRPGTIKLYDWSEDGSTSTDVLGDYSHCSFREESVTTARDGRARKDIREYRVYLWEGVWHKLRDRQVHLLSASLSADDGTHISGHLKVKGITHLSAVRFVRIDLSNE